MNKNEEELFKCLCGCILIGTRIYHSYLCSPSPRVKHIEDEIKELQKNKENEVEGGGESQPETTYEEKVKQ